MSETKTIYVVWTNTDLTEGRGHQVPIAYADSVATAARLAKNRGVMGSDADCRRFEAVKHGGHWCAPVSIEPPSEDDKLRDEANARKAAALAKARQLGLTDDDLEALQAKGYRTK
ncbi:hypothetical protein [Stutzerimonas nitrititolerans]|uniref:Uncharacterized protein n=1 Tax=Stutzerimonas nitrititolerans TaxID=2482751 RepID=A0ABX9UVJ2_9GAMM|nr:hypothetical protein [Stutzerimonas nitrititolerans]RMH97298.1 hypothetical protein EA795_19145 [Stutzerimonas nitrititolerans]